MPFLKRFLTWGLTSRTSRSDRALASIIAIVGRRRSAVLKISSAALILRLAPVLLPVVLKFTLDPLLNQRDVMMGGRSWSSSQLLVVVVVASVCVAFVRGIASYLFTCWSGVCGHQLVADMRVAMFEHILRLPVRYVHRRGTGKVLLRFIGDSDALRSWMSRGWPNVCADAVLVSVLLFGMLWIDWRLALLIALPLPFLILAIQKMGRRLHELTRGARFLQAEFTGHVQARLDVIDDSKWIDAEGGLRENAQALAGEVSRRNAHREEWAALLKGISNGLAFLSVPLLLWFGISGVWNGGLSTGEFFAFIWLAAHLGVAVHRLSEAIVVREKARVSLQRMLRLLERSAERGRGSKQKRYRPRGESVRCEELVFGKSGPGSPGQPLSVCWEGPEEFVLPATLDGDRLFEVLLGVQRPISGTVKYDGNPLDTLNIVTLRKSVGWVPAKPAIFDTTIEENICVANPRKDRDDLLRLLEQTGIADGDPDDWLARDCGPLGCHLNDDDALAIAVLRVLIRDPRVILVGHPGVETILSALRTAGRSNVLALVAGQSLTAGDATIGEASEASGERSPPPAICRLQDNL